MWKRSYSIFFDYVIYGRSLVQKLKAWDINFDYNEDSTIQSNKFRYPRPSNSEQIQLFFQLRTLYRAKHWNAKYNYWLQRDVKIKLRVHILWMFLFSIFRYVSVSIIWKTQNTVSGYKKRSKIQSHEIFWSAIPELWVVSFGTFASWPFYRRKSWETQNTVFGYKKESKFNPTRFSDSLPQILCCFMLVFSQNHFLRITQKYGSLTCFPLQHFSVFIEMLRLFL